MGSGRVGGLLRSAAPPAIRVFSGKRQQTAFKLFQSWLIVNCYKIGLSDKHSALLMLLPEQHS